MTTTDDRTDRQLPTLTAARRYLRADGDEMLACFAPYDDDDVCEHGWAVRRLARDRRRSRKAMPAATMATYQLAHYEVVCRADDDHEHAADLAAAMVVVAERDAGVCDDRLDEWQAAVAAGRRTDDEAAKQVTHWQDRAAELRALAAELRRDYLTDRPTN